MDNNNFDGYTTMPGEELSNSKNKSGKLLWGVIGGIIGVVSTLIIVTVVAILWFVRTANTNILSDISDSKNARMKLDFIVSLIEDKYYKDVTEEELLEGVYKGVVEALDDPYSAYYTADEYKSAMESLTGDYAGIGALLSKNLDDGKVTVNKVYEGSPAEKAGLLDGDIILKADENLSTAEDLDTFVTHIRGEAGTDVTLTIMRGNETMEIVCTRDNVSTPTVEYQMLDSNIGYIEISQFGSKTGEDFKAAMEDLKKQGMTSVIYDLRSNGGGMVDSVVEVCDYLLPEGVIVSIKDKNGKTTEFSSDAKHIEIPAVVLVDENTASSSEIFSGAIRDYNYGTIIGTQTFGKGIVQTTLPLTDGSAVKLTTEKYYTPSGECIHEKGIKPDIELEFEFLGQEGDTYSVELDNQIQAGIEVLNGTYEE